ncbi:MAG: DUF1206 domain-containing protein, partial [Cyanobacteria bacterium P01_C01_bin.73]
MKSSRSLNLHRGLWIEILARLGYLAKGVVYGTIGLLSIRAALDLGGDPQGSTGAVKALASQPFGQIMLVLLIIGFGGYVQWRFVQAIYDPEHRTKSVIDFFRRLGYAISGLFYGGLAISTVRILLWSAQDDSSGTAQEWALRIMVQPLGRWVIGAVGLIIIGLAGCYFYRAIKADFCKYLKLHKMSPMERTWATWLGRFGVAARGGVYAIVGALVIQAAWRFSPSKVETSG